MKSVNVIKSIQLLTEKRLKPIDLLVVNDSIYARLMKKFPELEGKVKSKIVMSQYPTFDIKVRQGEVIDKIRDWLSIESAKFGWYVGAVQSYGKGSLIDLYPNYDEVETTVPKVLYHFTKPEYVDGILKHGIKPSKSKNFSEFMYPPRVYVAKSKSGGSFLGKGISVPVEIDVTKLRPGTTFYKDMNWGPDRSLWTYSHIPAEAVKVD